MPESLRDVLKNNIHAKLSRDEVVLSMSVRLVESPEIARIAEVSGFDTLYIDMEHSSISFDAASRIFMAALEAGVTPMVRIPGHGPEFVSRLLDIGAMGIIAPQIRSAEDARRVVANAKFPPFGERSVTQGIPQFRHRQWPLKEARELMNDLTTVVVMIESKGALEQVEEIAAVPGVDILFIGTNDLCADLGIDGQFDHQLVTEAYKRVIKAAKANGKHVGIGGLANKPERMAEFIRMGARYVSVGQDLSFLMANAKARCEAVKKSLPALAPTSRAS